MKLRNNRWAGPEFDIAASVPVAIDKGFTGDGNGQLEAMADELKELSKLTGRLLQILHQNNLLSPQEVMAVLDSYNLDIVE